MFSPVSGMASAMFRSSSTDSVVDGGCDDPDSTGSLVGPAPDVVGGGDESLAGVSGL